MSNEPPESQNAGGHSNGWPPSNFRRRQRGAPWTAEEHRRFLVGLNEIGAGKWKDMSEKYVKTKSATQIASHAQKYFKREGQRLNNTRRRASINDVKLAGFDEPHGDRKRPLWFSSEPVAQGPGPSPVPELEIQAEAGPPEPPTLLAMQVDWMGWRPEIHGHRAANLHREPMPQQVELEVSTSQPVQPEQRFYQPRQGLLPYHWPSAPPEQAMPQHRQVIGPSCTAGTLNASNTQPPFQPIQSSSHDLQYGICMCNDCFMAAFVF